MTASGIKINQRYMLDGVTYTVRHVDVEHGVLWIEPFPTRGMWPVSLAHFIESNPVLLVAGRGAMLETKTNQ